MTSVESEQVIPELFEIPEQNLILRNERGYDLVLPFSQNIIWASIDGNIVEIGYVENMELQKISLAINEEGKLDFEDYAFLLEPEDQHILKSRLVSR